jgi:hypothetical protein
MNSTIFHPDNIEILESLKNTLSGKEYPKSLAFLSHLYVLHRCFDEQRDIDTDKHKPKSIHSTKVRAILGRTYMNTIKKLENLGQIEVTQSYCKKRFSKGYRLSKRVLESTFSKAGQQNRLRVEKEREDVIGELAPVYKRIIADSMELQFDYLNAMDFINKDKSLSPMEKNWREGFCALAQTADFSSTVCKQGRLYYVLTFSPRELRQFFRIKRGNLVQIDVKSCQVLLHTILYAESCQEKEYFDAICSNGQFWSLINSGLKKPFDLKDANQRREFKEKCFQHIFYTSLDYLYANSQYVKAFKEYFPILYDLIFEEKARLRKSGEQLASKMQAIESEIIIHGAVKHLQSEYPENIFLTIHDCIECEDIMVESVKSAISDAFASRIGVIPGLDIKALNEQIAPRAMKSKFIEHETIGINRLKVKMIGEVPEMAGQQTNPYEGDWTFDDQIDASPDKMATKRNGDYFEDSLVDEEDPF